MHHVLPNPEQSTAPDVGLWELYHPLDPEDAVYRWLTPSQEYIASERTKFEASQTTGNTYLPDFRPRNIDQRQLDKREAELLALKDSVPQHVDAPHLRQAYRWRINECIGNIRLVRAAASGDDRRFQAYNSFIYGQPNPEVFAAVSDWFSHDAEAATESENPAVREAAHDVLKTLGHHRGDRSLLIPDPAIFEAVRANHYSAMGFVATLLAGIELPAGERVTAQNGDPILRRMLENIGSSQKIVDDHSWSNTPAELRRPPDYDMTPQEFIEYQAHELRHAVEYINGIKSPVRLTASGLDRYEIGNEGRAVVSEQVVNEDLSIFNDGERWQELISRHLAVSLGSGLAGGGKTKNSAETNEAIFSTARLFEYTHSPLDSQEDLDAATARAANHAWSLTNAVYKGTDGTGKAGVYRRPMIYLEGNLAVWDKARTDPHAIHVGDLGKFDIANDRHIAILQEAGMLPAKSDFPVL